jgi:hypothetical protein
LSEHHAAALARAVKTRLTATSEIWEGRVYQAAPLAAEDKKIIFPYVVSSHVGGGKIPKEKNDWVSLLWQIRVIAKDLGQAYDAAARISALFQNADVTHNNALDGGSDWEISTVAEVDDVHVPEQVDSGMLYHVGSVFRVVMQRK